jgi:hypothetical protein
MVVNLLAEAPSPNGRDMFAGLLSFLEKNTSLFMKELWAHLVSAMANSTPQAPLGIAQFILDAKREEMKAHAAVQARAMEVRARARLRTIMVGCHARIRVGCARVCAQVHT